MSAMLKHLVKRGLKLAGYEIAKFRPEYSLDFALKHLVLNTRPVVFDVGANKGQSIEKYLALFPRVEIHSFEPDPGAFKILTDRFGRMANIFLNNIALGESAGKLPLFRTDESGQNSLIPINLSGQWYTGSFEHLKPALCEHVEVDISTIDEYCEEKKVHKIDFLKMDIQGFEPQCLRGAVNILRNNRVSVIQVEIIFGDLYGKPRAFLDIEQLLNPFGYRLFGIFNISMHDSGDIRQLDAVYFVPQSA